MNFILGCNYWASNAGTEMWSEWDEKIIHSAKNYLLDDGYVVFELGINQSEAVKELFEKNGYEQIKTIKDLNSIERIIIAKLEY